MIGFNTQQRHKTLINVSYSVHLAQTSYETTHRPLSHTQLSLIIMKIIINESRKSAGTHELQHRWYKPPHSLGPSERNLVSGLNMNLPAPWERRTTIPIRPLQARSFGRLSFRRAVPCRAACRLLTNPPADVRPGNCSRTALRLCPITEWRRG